jgi:hypothetical protein
MFWLGGILGVIFLYLLIQKIQFTYRLCRPQAYTAKLFYRRFHRHLDWDKPRDFNEKIHWLKFYSDTSRWPELTDKYRVRRYVHSKGLGRTLNKLYAVYNSPQDIELQDLPNSFVLKANNGSGDILLVPDKTKITRGKILRHFHRRRPFGVDTAEPHYLKISPRIIAEKLLREDSGKSVSLIDYKFFCFNGELKYIYVCWDRDEHKVEHQRETYDSSWRLVKNAYPRSGRYQSRGLSRPKSFEQMKKMCRVLAKGFPFVRVDWYEVGGQPVFGELTFTPAAGFIDYYTPDFLQTLGRQIKLPPKIQLP